VSLRGTRSWRTRVFRLLCSCCFMAIYECVEQIFNVPNMNRYGYDLFNVVEESSTTLYVHICGLRFSPRRKNLAPHGYHSSRILGCLWSPRGYTILLVPGHDPPQDITIFMDVILNPGPSFSSAYFVANTNASLSDDQYATLILS